MTSQQAMLNKAKRYHANQIADARHEKMFFDSLSYKIDWLHRTVHKIKTLDTKI